MSIIRRHTHPALRLIAAGLGAEERIKQAISQKDLRLAGNALMDYMEVVTETSIEDQEIAAHFHTPKITELLKAYRDAVVRVTRHHQKLEAVI